MLYGPCQGASDQGGLFAPIVREGPRSKEPLVLNPQGNRMLEVMDPV